MAGDPREKGLTEFDVSPVYTTKMKGAGPQILGTGAKFKRVPCQKSCRVNRALVTERKRKAGANLIPSSLQMLNILPSHVYQTNQLI